MAWAMPLAAMGSVQVWSIPNQSKVIAIWDRSRASIFLKFSCTSFGMFEPRFEKVGGDDGVTGEEAAVGSVVYADHTDQAPGGVGEGFFGHQT